MLTRLPNFFILLQNGLYACQRIDFIPLLALRIYLFIVFWQAGINKYHYLENTISWFREGLHFPFPTLMAYLATYTEIIGAICLLLGFAVRWASIPLIVTMVVATFSVHFPHGWAAISEDEKLNSKLQLFLDWLEKTHPDKFQELEQLGKLVILNNGCEFAATFLLMLLVLFCFGPGKYFSIDYWIHRRFKDRLNS